MTSNAFQQLFSSVLLVTSLFGRSSTLSSHSPQDLLAYPKYSVSLQDWKSAVTNETATAFLSSEVDSDTQRGGDDVELSLSGDHPFGQNEDGFRNHIMRTVSGRAFFCRVPPVPSSKSKAQKPSTESSPSTAVLAATGRDDLKRKEEREKAEKEGLKKGLDLISSLKDRCIYTRLGWFTYSFCYGKGEIRQFHALMIPGHSHPYEDPNQDVYVLGFHVNHPQNPHHQARLDGTLPGSAALAAEGELTSLGKNRFSSASGPTMGLSDVLREESVLRSERVGDDEEFGQKMYLVQRWEGGTICDMTGKPRSVEVQFYCSTVATDHIALLRETSICEYLVVIHTPRLCSEPLFLDGGGRKGLDGGDEVKPIDCRPILSEEEIQSWKAKEEAREKKRAEEAARKQKLIEEQKVEAEKLKSDESVSPNAAQAPTEGDKQAAQDSSPKTTSSGSDAAEDDVLLASDPSQLVLDGKKHPTAEPGETSQKTAKTSQPDQENESKGGGTETPKGKGAGAQPEILEINPITVYFDADTGQVFMDEGTGGQARPPAESPGTNQQGGTDGQARQGTGGTGDQRDGRGRDVEGLAKALKESLGALLKDLRATEDRIQARGPQRPGQNSVPDLIAALKESANNLRKNKPLGPTGNGNSGGGKKTRSFNDPNNLKVSSKKVMSEEHLKMLKIYEGNFDFSEEGEEEESTKEGQSKEKK